MFYFPEHYDGMQNGIKVTNEMLKHSLNRDSALTMKVLHLTSGMKSF